MLMALAALCFFASAASAVPDASLGSSVQYLTQGLGCLNRRGAGVPAGDRFMENATLQWQT